MKKTNIKQIKDELFEFLEIKYTPKEIEHEIESTTNDIEIEILQAPSYSEWVDSLFPAAFATWHNGTDIDITTIPHFKRQKLIEHLLKKRPISAILESAVFTFWIKNIPRTMTHQIVRHRRMVFNQQSLRVSLAHNTPIRFPNGISDDDRRELVDIFTRLKAMYLYLIEKDIPPEEARNILPMGTTTHLTMTTNLKELMLYLKARTGKLAQNEHTVIAEKIKERLKQSAPEFYKLMEELK